MKQVGMIVASGVGLMIYCLLFEFRYSWHAELESLVLLRSTCAVAVAAITVLWAIYPSPFIVGLVSLGCLVSPPLFNPSLFAKPDWGFSAYGLITVGLLIGITILWQIIRR
jgi:hypothetical protein